MLNIVESRKNICRGPSGPRSAARLAVLESATARKDPKRIIHSIQQTPKSAATQVMVYPGGGSYPNHRLIDCEEIWQGSCRACTFLLTWSGLFHISPILIKIKVDPTGTNYYPAQIICWILLNQERTSAEVLWSLDLLLAWQCLS